MERRLYVFYTIIIGLLLYAIMLYGLKQYDMAEGRIIITAVLVFVYMILFGDIFMKNLTKIYYKVYYKIYRGDLKK